MLNKKNISKKLILIIRKSIFDLEIIEKFIAGIVLSGSEIKSLRLKNISINEAYIFPKKKELYVFNMYIADYQNINSYNLKHNNRPKRKLLMKKNEIKKIIRKIKEKGYIVSPLTVFINEKGWAKIEIALARKLKNYQIKEKLKEKEIKRKMEKKDFF